MYVSYVGESFCFAWTVFSTTAALFGAGQDAHDDHKILQAWLLSIIYMVIGIPMGYMLWYVGNLLCPSAPLPLPPSLSPIRCETLLLQKDAEKSDQRTEMKKDLLLTKEHSSAAPFYRLFCTLSLSLRRYMRLYNACQKDRALTYFFFFIFYSVHVSWCVWAFLSPPIGVQVSRVALPH